MFTKIFQKFKSKESPKGYPIYSHIDFEENFKLSPSISSQVAKDYSLLLKFESRNKFYKVVSDSGRDLYAIANMLSARYNLENKKVTGLTHFFASIVSARMVQIQMQELGIHESIWVATTCGLKKGDRNVKHIQLSGHHFDPALGVLTEEGYLLPGVAFGCTCISKGIIPGWNE